MSSETIAIYVYVSKKDALRGGKNRHGTYELLLTPQWVACLTDAQREKLVQIEPFCSAKALKDSTLLIEPTLDAVALYLQHLLDTDAKALAKQREKERMLAERHAAEIHQWLALSDDARIEKGWGNTVVKGVWHSDFKTGYSPCDDDWDRLREAYPVVMERYDAERNRLSELASEENRRRDAEIQAQKERNRVENEAQKEREHAERSQWIAEHGSERLRALVAENLKHDRTYRDERRAMEFPGWVRFNTICGTLKDAANASMQNIEELRRHRAQHPDSGVSLQWLADGEHIDGCDHQDDGYTSHEFRPGPVLTAEHIGETIVFYLYGIDE